MNRAVDEFSIANQTPSVQKYFTIPGINQKISLNLIYFIVSIRETWDLSTKKKRFLKNISKLFVEEIKGKSSPGRK